MAVDGALPIQSRLASVLHSLRAQGLERSSTVLRVVALPVEWVRTWLLSIKQSNADTAFDP